MKRSPLILEPMVLDQGELEYVCSCMYILLLDYLHNNTPHNPHWIPQGMWILRLLPKYIYPRLPKIVLLN